MKTDVNKMREAISILEKIEREDYGDLSTLIGNEALDECYDNDKQLHSLFCKYKDNDDVLEIINEILVCVCGWELATLVSMMPDYKYEGDEDEI